MKATDIRVRYTPTGKPSAVISIPPKSDATPFEVCNRVRALLYPGVATDDAPWRAAVAEVEAREAAVAKIMGSEKRR